MDNKILEQEGVILRGHFLLTSGLHSDIYFEKFRLLENPAILQTLISNVIEQLKDIDPDYIIGPVTGGIITAYDFARQMGCKSAYLEKRDNVLGLYRGTPINSNHNVIIVDDVLTTGKSVFASIDAVKQIGCNIAGICVLIDRSSNVDFGYPLFRAMKVEANTYKPDNCPLCRDGVELVRPGGKR